MTNKELKPIIDEIITNAFKRIEFAYQYHSENNPKTSCNKLTRLVFPKFRNGNTRISEQELRFAFVEAFNAYCDEHKLDLFYSIETPTAKKYQDFSTDPKVAEDGRSGEFDMVIFDKDLKRVCLIEFKANNADKVDHWKDILKLKEEGQGILCYFIEVLKSYDSRTPKSLKEKFATFFNKKEHQHYRNNGATINVRCFALEGERSEGVGRELGFEESY